MTATMRSRHRGCADSPLSRAAIAAAVCELRVTVDLQVMGTKAKLAGLRAGDLDLAFVRAPRLWSYDTTMTATDAVKADHMQYLKGLLATGELVAAGPRSDVAGGVLVFRDTADDELATFLAEDPFTTAGLIATTTIIDWNAGLGALAATV
jgi:uncharacterized protein YciI